LAQKLQIIVIEGTQVVEFKYPHRESFDTQPKGEPGNFGRIVSAIAEDDRMYHARPQDFNPARTLTDPTTRSVARGTRHVDFHRWLGKGEVRRTESGFNSVSE
jgi:hypothetical protein